MFEIYNDYRWIDLAQLTIQPDKNPSQSAVTLEFNLDILGKPRFRHSLSAAVPLTHEILSYDRWPAFLYDYIPQGSVWETVTNHYGIPKNEKNLWRILAEVPLFPPGNIRIKHAFFETSINQTEYPGFTKEELDPINSSFVENAQASGIPLGSASGAQGAAPKILLRKGTDGRYYLEGTLPDRLTTEAYILKLPPQLTEDKLLLAGEHVYLKIIQRLGHTSPLLHNEKIGNSLLIQRFDVEFNGDSVDRRGLESFYSMCSVEGHGMRVDHMDYITRLTQLSYKPADDLLEYLLREMTREALGDTDNHGRNSSIIKNGPKISLAPAYDMTPSRFSRELIVNASYWSRDLQTLPWSARIKTIFDRFGLDLNKVEFRLRSYYEALCVIHAEKSPTASLSIDFVAATRSPREDLILELGLLLSHLSSKAQISTGAEVKRKKDESSSQGAATSRCVNGREHCKNPIPKNRPTKTRGGRKLCSYCSRSGER